MITEILLAHRYVSPRWNNRFILLLYKSDDEGEDEDDEDDDSEEETTTNIVMVSFSSESPKTWYCLPSGWYLKNKSKSKMIKSIPDKCQCAQFSWATLLRNRYFLSARAQFWLVYKNRKVFERCQRRVFNIVNFAIILMLLGPQSWGAKWFYRRTRWRSQLQERRDFNSNQNEVPDIFLWKACAKVVVISYVKELGTFRYNSTVFAFRRHFFRSRPIFQV